MASGADQPSPETMRDELLAQLYVNRAELKGIALVQGIKALAALIPPAPPPPPSDDEARFSVIDQLDSLPRAEGQKLLKQEIKRYRSELAALEAAFIARGEKHG